jgi:hypothetical protein
MAERFTRKDHLPGWVAEMQRSMLTAIGLQLRQQLDTSEQLPPALAALARTYIDRNETEPDWKKLEEPQG